MSRLTQALLLISLLMITYSYLCRSQGIYFFWESDSVGWSLLFAGLTSLFIDRIKRKRAQQKGVVWEGIGLGFAAFALFVQSVLLLSFYNSEAFVVAKTYLKTNQKVAAEVGTIKGFGLNPTGSMHVQADTGGEWGNASISMTVKGDRKYEDLTVYAAKQPDSPEWVVDSLEYPQ